MTKTMQYESFTKETIKFLNKKGLFIFPLTFFFHSIIFELGEVLTDLASLQCMEGLLLKVVIRHRNQWTIIKSAALHSNLGKSKLVYPGKEIDVNYN